MISLRKSCDMSHDEFLDLVWRLEEILMHLDQLRSQIGKCREGCEGLDAQGEAGLCPTCCDWLAQVLDEEDRLSEDKECNDVISKLQEACDQDKTGQYERILNQSREGKVVN